MKNLIIILASIIFASEFCNAQSTLQVDIKDCRQESSFEYLSEFKVFRNDSLIKTIEPKHESNQTLKDLEYGKYRIEYKTMFSKTESVNIELTEKKKYTIDLCLNYLDHESDLYQPFIDRLENGESYSIQVSSQGCFHSSNETITIKRKSDKFYLTFQGKDRLLDNKEIRAIRYFEIELNYMESYGCTTTDTYVLKYKSKEVKISDGSCDWNGDYYLKKELNLTEE
ncbi:MAG: hypothetical protein NWR72_09635 [Bacteroidia bacterium]|nr:hypothetical protein [Bacteroidia bacterium]